MNFVALEHLDLTIYIIDGKLETDIFAKDIPIYLSRKSCHPQHVFKSVVKSAAIRLTTFYGIERLNIQDISMPVYTNPRK